MCITTTQKFYSCKCIIVRHVICADYVEHTRRQIDNLPCFQAKSRFVETLLGGCEPNIKCEQMKKERWTFDHWDANHGDSTFLENGVNLQYKMPQCLVQGEFTQNHGCLIGKTVKGPWRHLIEKGESIKGKSIEFKKDKKGKDKEIEIEDDVDVEMDIVSQVKSEDAEMRQ